MRKVVVTGIGIISSIGNSPEETLESLLQKKSGISKISILNTIHKDEFLLGEIKYTNDELQQIAGIETEMPLTRTALLGLIAAKQAVADAKIDTAGASLISATTVGGMDRSELYYKEFLNNQGHRNFIDTHPASNSTETIADLLCFGGIISTISTACSSSLNSIIFGSRLIKSGKTDTVVVGGTDALSKFTLNGFNTLMILDREHCRPFDASRSGLNLGEGAAYLVLQDKDIALKQGKKIYAEIAGYSNANDAFHQTASSDDGIGPYLAMKQALGNIAPEKLAYINAHGTGTDNNDLTESLAIKKLFGNSIPPFSSTKAYTGHTLGAAGVIESVFSILALQNQTAFPNINFKNPIPETGLSPITDLIKLDNAQFVMSNSFGFGGNDSSLLFAAPNAEYSLGNDTNSKAVFINAAASVSPAINPETNEFEIINDVEVKYLQNRKPAYKEFIHPKVLRRMSKIVRDGIVASSLALKVAGIEKTDAIITSTGMGCQADTEKFLNQMLDNNEGLLTPTSFIQSTHNTVGGSIALRQKNHGYNSTYVHRTFSFESALADAMMMIKNGEANTILAGGFDELTEESWKIKTHINYYKSEETAINNLFNDKKQGALAGEGSSFFVLSNNKSLSSRAKLVAVNSFFKPEKSIHQIAMEMLENEGLIPDDIDALICGLNGDADFDNIYYNLWENNFKKSALLSFKNLSGEYDTASAFATHLACEIFNSQQINEEIIIKGNAPVKLNNILIYNQFRNTNHSFILLQNI